MPDTLKRETLRVSDFLLLVLNGRRRFFLQKDMVWRKVNMRIMGLDFGSKTVGVAVCDELGYTAQGVERPSHGRKKTSCVRHARESKR